MDFGGVGFFDYDDVAHLERRLHRTGGDTQNLVAKDRRRFSRGADNKQENNDCDQDDQNDCRNDVDDLTYHMQNLPVRITSIIIQADVVRQAKTV